MKLSNREKLLLAVLLVIGLGYLYYSFLLTPQLQKVSQVTESLTQKRQDMQFSQIEADPNNRLYTDYKGLNAKISAMTINYFPVINQEKIILILEQMFKEAGLNIPVVTFTEPGLDIPEETSGSVFPEQPKDPILQRIIDEVNGKAQENKTEETAAQQEKQGIQLAHMNATVAFEGGYFEVLKFMNLIENYEKNIVIKSINMTATADKQLTGNINLDFYAIPKLNKQQDAAYLKWDIYGVYGKDNPFAAISANTGGTSAVQPKAEFTLITSPIMSDLPSIVVGKTVDNRGDTQIYADNIGNEAVELQVTKEGDKYFYKYKTSSSSYPADYSQQGIEFSPEGNAIQLQVISTPRTGAQDKSGVTLTVVNKTDLEFQIQVSNDDASQPRFSTTNNSGRVSVSR